MNAIEFSQQKELKEVITGHIKTSDRLSEIESKPAKTNN